MDSHTKVPETEPDVKPPRLVFTPTGPGSIPVPDEPRPFDVVRPVTCIVHDWRPAGLHVYRCSNCGEIGYPMRESHR